MTHSFCNISESEQLITNAANILFETFLKINRDSWPTFDSALHEVRECIGNKNICSGISINNQLIGWIGLRPMYEKTWELHPMVISENYQKKGYGMHLIKELERLAQIRGIIGIVLGTDDETYRTSLSQIDLNKNNIFTEIKKIRNLKNHPYEFYYKSGYIIVGAIPNANGLRKPDIWMWKSLVNY
jgi:aminoglycoside 6'-N-acetyltransferase I